jgi:hypothetical protein
MSRWTHAVCDDCFFERHPSPVNQIRIVEQHRIDEDCCYCGKPTRSGLYDRNDPALTGCLGRDGNVHRDEDAS